MKTCLMIVMCCVMACSTPVSNEVGTDSEATAARKIFPSAVLARRPLQEATAAHVFSSRTAPDQFRLQLFGDSVLTGTLRLSIVSAAGDTLLREQFPATALLDYGLSSQYGERPTPIQQAAYIRQRITAFFAVDKFRRVAIGHNESFDEDYSNKIIWQEVKQMELPGFFYNLYEEDGRNMAYSRQLGKAVIYKKCC